MTSIMIVEDDRVISSILCEELSRWGYRCEVVKKFNQVLAEFQSFQPDVVLLDLNLPFFNGFYWCQEIRKQSEVPIIFISSADSNMNIVTAINQGADDYITKPFDLSVLIAKIGSLVRRSYVFGGQTTRTYGEYVFNFAENCIEFGNQTVYLTTNENKILTILYSNLGKLTSKDELMTKLWESESFVDSNTLSVNMTRLRKKLASIDLNHVIETIKGNGYLLVEYNEV